MATKTELETKTEEYALHVPKIPRQFIDVFDRDIANGDYGMSAETADTVFEYTALQQKLASFHDLTFSPEFISRLPEEVRKKLDQNLYPGIPLGHLEIPTTDKVLLTELLTADTLTDALSKSPVEIWVTPYIQKELSVMGMEVATGLQEINYASLPLHIKHLLVSVMEYQEGQIYSMLVARQRFPDGVPTRLGFRELFAKDEVRGEIVTFANLTNLEQQSRAAQEALDHPVELTMSRLLHKVRKEEQPQQSQGEETFDEKEYEQRERKRLQKRLTQGIEYEAQRNWWEWWNEHGVGLKIMKAVAAHLRPRYANKTIYEIFETKTTEEQHEVLSAFWRREGTRQMAHEEENWIVHELYLRPDGVLELHYVNSVYHKRERYKETGELENDWNVASVDQAVRWIREEMDGMEALKEKWQTAGFSATQAVESTLIAALGEKIDSSVREEINDLPDWFINALTKEEQLYRRLPRAYTPKPNPDDLLFSFTMSQEPKPANLLKDYFISKQLDLDRFQRLLTTPQELYSDLELDASATVDDVKVAYRRIAKETRAIHISSADTFDKKEWDQMNDRFIRATRAYHALTRYPIVPSGITTLGRIRQYFN